MIFFLTVIVCSVWYLFSILDSFDDENTKDRAKPIDHKDAMGAGFGFIVVLISSVILGAILELIFWIII